jgi:RsiW-degrading membrane proteinase PrsW (M82 family)
VLGSGVLFVQGVANPVGLLIAVPCASAAMAVVVACYLWLDRWEPEPTRLLLLAFLWGATVAVIVSVTLEVATSEVLGSGPVLTVFGPIIEEAAKGGFLLVMLTGSRRREFDGVVDGLVYAGFAAVGFAFIEDIGYLVQSFGQGTGTAVTTVVLRLVVAPFAHPLFTSLTGLGFGLAVSRPRSSGRWMYPAAGFLGAVALHSLWNGSLTFGLFGYLVVYVLIMVPAFVAAVLIARYHRRRERDVVQRQLPAMVYFGWITSAEAGWLATLAHRRAWLREVRRRTGRDAANALRGFQTAVTELAFLRDKVERGVAQPDAYYLHAELVDALARSRRQATAELRESPMRWQPVAPAPPAGWR